VRLDSETEYLSKPRQSLMSNNNTGPPVTAVPDHHILGPVRCQLGRNQPQTNVDRTSEPFGSMLCSL
jgi:hypothetical protein